MKTFYSIIRISYVSKKSWMQKIFSQKHTSHMLSGNNLIRITGEDPDRLSIEEDLKKARFALETAYAGFDNATDPDLIDCYIFEVNSALKRYRYLLHLYDQKQTVTIPQQITNIQLELT